MTSITPYGRTEPGFTSSAHDPVPTRRQATGLSNSRFRSDSQLPTVGQPPQEDNAVLYVHRPADCDSRGRKAARVTKTIKPRTSQLPLARRHNQLAHHKPRIRILRKLHHPTPRTQHRLLHPLPLPRVPMLHARLYDPRRRMTGRHIPQAIPTRVQNLPDQLDFLLLCRACLAQLFPVPGDLLDQRRVLLPFLPLQLRFLEFRDLRRR